MAWTDLTKLSWLQFRPPGEYMLDAMQVANQSAAIRQRDVESVRQTEAADEINQRNVAAEDRRTDYYKDKLRLDEENNNYLRDALGKLNEHMNGGAPPSSLGEMSQMFGRGSY